MWINRYWFNYKLRLFLKKQVSFVYGTFKTNANNHSPLWYLQIFYTVFTLSRYTSIIAALCYLLIALLDISFHPMPRLCSDVQMPLLLKMHLRYSGVSVPQTCGPYVTRWPICVPMCASMCVTIIINSAVWVLLITGVWYSVHTVYFSVIFYHN